MDQIAAPIAKIGTKWHAYIMREKDASFVIRGAASKQEIIDGMVNYISEQSCRLATIVCNDGTILIVRNFHGAWHQEIIHGPDSRSSTHAATTFDEAIDYAKRHAQQSYGGISYVNVR